MLSKVHIQLVFGDWNRTMCPTRSFGNLTLHIDSLSEPGDFGRPLRTSRSPWYILTHLWSDSIVLDSTIRPNCVPSWPFSKTWPSLPTDFSSPPLGTLPPATSRRVPGTHSSGCSFVGVDAVCLARSARFSCAAGGVVGLGFLASLSSNFLATFSTSSSTFSDSSANGGINHKRDFTHLIQRNLHNNSKLTTVS